MKRFAPSSSGFAAGLAMPAFAVSRVVLAGLLASFLALASCKKTNPPLGPTDAGPGPNAAPAPYPSATQTELGWLAPLAPGVRARGFLVVAMSRVDQGSVWISFQKEQTVTTVQVNTLSGTPEPAAKTAQFAISFASGSDTYGPELAALVAEVLTKNAHVTPPPGLLQFSATQRAPDLSDSGVPQPLRPR